MAHAQHPTTSPATPDSPSATKPDRAGRRAGDPTASVPLPEVGAAAEATPPTAAAAADAAAADAPLAEISADAPNAEDGDRAETSPEAEGEAEPPKDSKFARSLRKREAKLEQDKAAWREQLASAEGRIAEAHQALEQARSYGRQMQEREQGFVARLREDPVAVLGALGISNKELAARLLGQQRAPVDTRARDEVEALKRELHEIRTGVQASAAQAAQAQSEAQALGLIKTDGAYKTLATLLKQEGGSSYVVAELNDAAAKLLAAGQRLGLREIVAAVERKHARLATIYGQPGTTAAATPTVRPGPTGAPPANAKTPSLSSRDAGQRSTVQQLDPIRDAKEIDRRAIQLADEMRRKRVPPKR